MQMPKTKIDRRYKYGILDPTALRKEIETKQAQEHKPRGRNARRDDRTGFHLLPGDPQFRGG